MWPTQDHCDLSWEPNAILPRIPTEDIWTVSGTDRVKNLYLCIDSPPPQPTNIKTYSVFGSDYLQSQETALTQFRYPLLVSLPGFQHLNPSRVQSPQHTVCSWALCRWQFFRLSAPSSKQPPGDWGTLVVAGLVRLFITAEREERDNGRKSATIFCETYSYIHWNNTRLAGVPANTAADWKCFVPFVLLKLTNIYTTIPTTTSFSLIFDENKFSSTLEQNIDSIIMSLWTVTMGRRRGCQKKYSSCPNWIFHSMSTFYFFWFVKSLTFPMPWGRTRVSAKWRTKAISGAQTIPAPDINRTSPDISLYLNSSKELNQAKYNAENVRQTKSLLDDIQPLKHFTSWLPIDNDEILEIRWLTTQLNLN